MTELDVVWSVENFIENIILRDKKSIWIIQLANNLKNKKVALFIKYEKLFIQSYE